MRDSGMSVNNTSLVVRPRFILARRIPRLTSSKGNSYEGVANYMVCMQTIMALGIFYNINAKL